MHAEPAKSPWVGCSEVPSLQRPGTATALERSRQRTRTSLQLQPQPLFCVMLDKTRDEPRDELLLWGNDCLEGVQAGPKFSSFRRLHVRQTPGHSCVYGKGRSHRPTILTHARPYAIFLSIYNIMYFIQ